MSDRNVKCPRCKSYRFEDDFLKEGRRLKTCINCREKQKIYRENGGGKCIHNRFKYQCIECKGSKICKHNRQKSHCIECNGSQICEHIRIRSNCKKCSDPVKITIQNWIYLSKQSDKKHSRYDVDRFIDRCFLKELVKDYQNCYYCNVELQYLEYNDTLATIERLNNAIGHIKSNCVLACRKCNYSRVGSS